MARKALLVEGFEGVQRRSDRVYSHAVVAVPDVVRQAEANLEWAKGRAAECNRDDEWDRQVVAAGEGGSFRPKGWKFDKRNYPGDVEAASKRLAQWPDGQARLADLIAKAEAVLENAKARVAAGEVKPEVISFHASLELARKAAAAARVGRFFLLNVEVRPVLVKG